MIDTNEWRQRSIYEPVAINIDEVCDELDALTADRDNLAHSLGYAEATIKVLTAERDAARKENDTLRGIIANADILCMYCGLSKSEQGKCASGFPGCARADDMMSAPDFGNDALLAELAQVEAPKEGV